MMLSRLIRRPVQLCFSFRRMANTPLNLVASASDKSLEFYRDYNWYSLVSNFDFLSVEDLSQASRSMKPSLGVLALDDSKKENVTTVHSIHALYYVAMKKLPQLHSPSLVLPFLSLWLLYPSNDHQGRENDQYTTSLCRHIMAMASKLTAEHVAELISAFNVPHVTQPPETVLSFTRQWVDAAAPHLPLSDLVTLLVATAHLDSRFYPFHDLCSRKLQDVVDYKEIDCHRLAKCIFALSKSGTWSEQWVSSAVPVLLSKSGVWSNEYCHLILAAFFNFGCAHDQLLSRAVHSYSPAMQENGVQCASILCHCLLLDWWPSRLVDTVRTWVRTQDETYWETSDGLKLMEKLLLLDIYSAIDRPKEQPLLSPEQFALVLEKFYTEVRAGKVATGSIRKHQELFDYLARTANGRQYVQTEVMVFTYVLDMMMVMTGEGKFLPHSEHPSVVSSPLVPPALADRLKTCGLFSDVEYERFQWHKGAFRAIAFTVCGPEEFVRGTDRVRGPTALREKVLYKLGYEVVRVRLDGAGRFNRSELQPVLRNLFAVDL